jgi:hypothetical protein
MHNVPAHDGLTWFKSSYSGGSGSDCVEVARHAAGLLVRDSKDPGGPVLNFPASSWAAFAEDVRAGHFPN